MLQEKILYVLEKNRGELVTGGDLAKQMNVSRTAVWKAVNLLRSRGNEIESIPNSGYILKRDSDGLSRLMIEQYLRTETFGREIEILKTVDSTMNYIKRLDTAHISEGYSIIADEQTGGRGRLSRQFYSPAYEGIYLSFLVKPNIKLSETTFLTICTAVSVSRALEKVCEIKTDIKWVNDIYCGGRKICGILTEAAISAEMQSVEYAVIGLGVNTGNIPSQISDTATSIYNETKKKGIRNLLISQILNEFEEVYFDFVKFKRKNEILDEYTSKLFVLGRQVEVNALDKKYKASVIGINEDAELLIECEDGTRLSLNSGEISLI